MFQPFPNPTKVSDERFGLVPGHCHRLGHSRLAQPPSQFHEQNGHNQLLGLSPPLATSGLYDFMFILTTTDTRSITGKQAMSSKNPHLPKVLLSGLSSYQLMSNPSLARHRGLPWTSLLGSVASSSWGSSSTGSSGIGSPIHAWCLMNKLHKVNAHVVRWLSVDYALVTQEWVCSNTLVVCRLVTIGWSGVGVRRSGGY